MRCVCVAYAQSVRRRALGTGRGPRGAYSDSWRRFAQCTEQSEGRCWWAPLYRRRERVSRGRWTASSGGVNDLVTYCDQERRGRATARALGLAESDDCPRRLTSRHDRSSVQRTFVARRNAGAQIQSAHWSDAHVHYRWRLDTVADLL